MEQGHFSFDLDLVEQGASNFRLSRQGQSDLVEQGWIRCHPWRDLPVMPHTLLPVQLGLWLFPICLDGTSSIPSVDADGFVLLL